MKFIGITGGVGAGKSTVLAYLRENYRVRTLVADEIAHDIMEPGYDCYKKLQKEFAKEEIWQHNGRINRQRLAAVIFADEQKRKRLNEIVHPAVKEYILQEVEKERRSQSTDYVILEAALLIEDHYDQICDELWYVYVTEFRRKKRLMESRGYTQEHVDQIFESQLPDEEFRKHCSVVIDNNGTTAELYLQLVKLLQGKGENRQMDYLEQTQTTELEYNGKQLVFGLDIGTRNVVGTVGYKDEGKFIVIAQYSMEHETRAMLDGQIHDIGRVGRTISRVKEKLEDQIGQELTEVCIAAAGRVLKTVTTDVHYEFEEETVVTRDHIHTLDLLGVDQAHQTLMEKNDTNYKFYCVGYSVMKYYLNGEIFSNLESHKANVISEKIIVTFLPEDVVDGLYMAVGFAGLTVANMTLEPIAAIDVAIPEHFRMLNIALVDVGAGTSDISLTKDGSIIAYGMIPIAGDEITETIVQHYLVDFKMAEHMKLAAGSDDEIEFEDIMALKHKIPAQEIWDLTDPLVDKMTTEISSKIKELNGDQTVSATFIVGGGGKIHGFAEMLAKKLELPIERVALRGEEVLREVTFLQEEIKKDPLIVTPIGICLNYYEQKNNFIIVHFNGERLRLYDNNKLTIVDAAIQAGFPNDQLFPKRGKEIHFLLNGKPRIVRGEAGESAVVRMNDQPASINDPIVPNCFITIEPSTEGGIAHYMVGELEEYHNSSITFEVNGKLITCPRYVEVNGVLEPPTYEIREGDRIETRSYYTVEQIAEFMDVELDPDAEILVNNRVEELDAMVYENFSVDWKVLAFRSTPQDVYPDAPKREKAERTIDKGEAGLSKDQEETEETSGDVMLLGTKDSAETEDEKPADADHSESELAKTEEGTGSESEDAKAGEDADSESKSAKAGEDPGSESDSAKTKEGSGSESESAKTGEDSGSESKSAKTGQGSASESKSAKTGEDSGSESESAKAGEGSGSESESAKTGEDLDSDRESAKTGEDLDSNRESAKGGEENGSGPENAEKSHSETENAKPSEESRSEPENVKEKEENRSERENASPLEESGLEAQNAKAEEETASLDPKPLTVKVNGKDITFKDTKDHIFVDIFDYIEFDLSNANATGRSIVTTVNGENAQYMQKLNQGDVLDIRWEER